MTIREIANDTDFEEPLEIILAIFQVLRTAIQGEAATLEGCCSSLHGFLALYGKLNYETIDRFLNDIGSLADIDIPTSIIIQAANCDN
jgi:hypothetical protein